MGGSEDMDDGCAVIGRGSAGAEERYNRDDDSPALAHAQTFSSPGKIQPLPPGNEIIIYNYSSLSRPRHPHHRTLDPLLPRCLPYVPTPWPLQPRPSPRMSRLTSSAPKFSSLYTDSSSPRQLASSGGCASYLCSHRLWPQASAPGPDRFRRCPIWTVHHTRR